MSPPRVLRLFRWLLDPTVVWSGFGTAVFFAVVQLCTNNVADRFETLKPVVNAAGVVGEERAHGTDRGDDKRRGDDLPEPVDPDSLGFAFLLEPTPAMPAEEDLLGAQTTGRWVRHGKYRLVFEGVGRHVMGKRGVWEVSGDEAIWRPYTVESYLRGGRRLTSAVPEGSAAPPDGLGG